MVVFDINSSATTFFVRLANDFESFRWQGRGISCRTCSLPYSVSPVPDSVSVMAQGNVCLPSAQ
jgi:hypothetical protein